MPDHYENFPVASLLCPPALRPAVAALYGFARTADDLADEGDATPQARLDLLSAYRDDLLSVAAGQPPSARWQTVFTPLAAAITRHALPLPLLLDLLSAFCQDIEKTRDGTGYADWAELMDYCRRSANPVGRLLLHLYGVHDAQSLDQSDRICTALQVINFWQDLGQDIPRGRFYLPEDRCAFHQVARADLQALRTTPAIRKLVAEGVTWARITMQAGSPLVHTLPGRAGWELRLVVQGGLRVLEKIEALHCATLEQRPTIGRTDLPRLLWRSLWM